MNVSRPKPYPSKEYYEKKERKEYCETMIPIYILLLIGGVIVYVVPFLCK